MFSKRLPRQVGRQTFPPRTAHALLEILLKGINPVNEFKKEQEEQQQQIKQYAQKLIVVTILKQKR